MQHVRKIVVAMAAGMLIGGVALPSSAQPGKDAREKMKAKAEERREDRKEAREEKKEKREELREEHAEKKARHQELKEKEAAGTLTDEEKAELEKLEEGYEKRKERHEELKKRHQELKKTRKDRRREARRKIVDKYPNIANRPKLRAELKVHAHRMARLNRAKVVAEAEGRDDLVEKIDKLIEKEQSRHQAKMEKMKDAKEEAK